MIIETNLSLTQIFDRLKSLAEKETASFWFVPLWFLGGNKFYFRNYRGNKFYLYKLPSKTDLFFKFRTYFFPVLYGDISHFGEKNRVRIKLGFHPIAYIFFAAFLYILGLLTVKNYHEILNKPVILFIILSIVVILGLFVFLPYREDKKELVKIINEIFYE